MTKHSLSKSGDLSSNAEDGKKEPKAIVLTLAQAEQLPLANVHFHLGAEHKSDEYNDGTDAEAYDAAHDTRRLSDSGLDAMTYDDSRLSACFLGPHSSLEYIRVEETQWF